MCRANAKEKKFTDGSEEELYRKNCFKNKCGVVQNDATIKRKWHGDHVVLPTYVGCYNDSEQQHDLKNLIGTNIKVKTCFDRAKAYGYAYAGL